MCVCQALKKPLSISGLIAFFRSGLELLLCRGRCLIPGGSNSVPALMSLVDMAKLCTQLFGLVFIGNGSMYMTRSHEQSEYGKRKKSEKG